MSNIEINWQLAVEGRDNHIRWLEHRLENQERMTIILRGLIESGGSKEYERWRLEAVEYIGEQ
jgi:hypothetical protein